MLEGHLLRTVITEVLDEETPHVGIGGDGIFNDQVLVENSVFSAIHGEMVAQEFELLVAQQILSAILALQKHFKVEDEGVETELELLETGR